MNNREKLKVLIRTFGGTNEAFANHIGVSPSTVHSWLGRNVLTHKAVDAILRNCEGVTLQWLDDDESPRFYTNVVATCGHQEQAPVTFEESVPVSIPGVHARTFIQVRGCSMLPTIKQGDLVGLDPVGSPDDIVTGHIYLVITHDEERMIKRITQVTPTHLTLTSDNPGYRPFQVPRQAVLHLFRVTWHGESL